MKKVISIAICAAIIISAIQIFPMAIAANSPTIICESKKCAPGDSFTLAVELENNPGFNVLELTPVCSDGLTIVNVKNDVENSFFTKGNQYVWALGDNYNGNKLLTLTVEASDELKTGEYSVGFEFRKCENWDKEAVIFSVVSGTVSVTGNSGDCGDNASWDFNTESGKLTISGSGEMAAASFGDNAGKIKSVVIGNEITKISSGAFDGLNNLKEVNIFGNPELADGAIPDGYTGVIKAFSGTNAQSYCTENGIKFEGLEEYDVAGYQKNLFEENSYRIVSQMRWAEYYDKAGYDIVATLDDGTKRKISVDIKTVYKSIAGKNEKGELITVFTPEDDCYASAIVFTGLPEMVGDEKIIFAFTPYVYNKYSKEKIVLDTEYLVYTKDGFAKYIPEPVHQILVLSDKTSDGEAVTWEKFN